MEGRRCADSMPSTYDRAGCLVGELKQDGAYEAEPRSAPVPARRPGMRPSGWSPDQPGARRQIVAGPPRRSRRRGHRDRRPLPRRAAARSRRRDVPANARRTRKPGARPRPHASLGTRPRWKRVERPPPERSQPAGSCRLLLGFGLLGLDVSADGQSSGTRKGTLLRLSDVSKSDVEVAG